MKGAFSTSKFIGYLILVFYTALSSMQAQQNNTLFFMNSVPESNYVNPAIQIECGTFIGLPVVSSFHANIANSAFTGTDYVALYTDGTYQRRRDMNTSGWPAKNYLLTEFHSVLFALGKRRNNLYYIFTIMEKDNSMVMYTPDLLAFTLRGSQEFEGQMLNLKGAKITFNHYREYAFGISKKYSHNLALGFKAKVLFGEYNFTTGKSQFNLYIEQGTRNIDFDVHGIFHSSLPGTLREEGPDIYRFQHVYDAPLAKQLMNFENPGLALDFGFIYQYNDQWTFSGSLLDLGFIWYRSNLCHYTVDGNFTYTGPFGYNQVDGSYLWDFFDEMNLNMDETVTNDAYLFFLDPRLYLGASYKLSKRYQLNLLLYSRLLPGKLQTGTTVSLLTRSDKRLKGSISWSYMNNSLVNVGLGLAYGRKPVQLYMVSDNIVGFILPLNTKNVNLRFGINLIIGCKSQFNINQCGCEWLKTEQNRRLRKEKFRRGKN